MTECIRKILDFSRQGTNIALLNSIYDDTVHNCHVHNNKDACLRKEKDFKNIRIKQDEQKALYNEIITECSHLI